jgi:DNA-binding transcriptional LysR family regulator
MLGAAMEGVGLAQLPEPMVAESLRTGKLTHVLQAYAPTMPGVFLYYPSRRQIMPKLRAFIDHVKSRPAVDGKARVKGDFARVGARKKREPR